ncbi:MAG: c-type cytochrome biogenesis protein CcsB [Actinomycetota bacterium]
MSLLAVVIGLVVLQRRLGLGHLMGFVLALATTTMAIALMLYTDPGPIVPSLHSYWIRIHVTSAMVASSIFMVAFAATALYLVKDTAERRVAARSGQGFAGSTVGAASVTPGAGTAAGEGAALATDDDTVPAAGGDQPDDRLGGDAVEGAGYASPLEQRRVLAAWPFGVVPAAVVGPFALVVYQAPVGATVSAAVAAAIGLLARWSVPHLPDAKTLDTLAYRTIAFGFPIWTFAVIAGAIWAEEAWGRFWGWDPKETGSFFTWVLYAAYLHARSTSGWRGRRAAWIGVVSFAALMVTYYVVNLFVVGLHSYAGV